MRADLLRKDMWTMLIVVFARQLRDMAVQSDGKLMLGHYLVSIEDLFWLRLSWLSVDL